jgi:hypothetical protein
LAMSSSGAGCASNQLRKPITEPAEIMRTLLSDAGKPDVSGLFISLLSASTSSRRSLI